jgi:arylsulfatase A-like enzyme
VSQDVARPWSASDNPRAAWNVLLVSLDTTRPDHLETCGGAPVPTPALNRVAANGFVFSEMITPVPVTLPAHASLFTGQNPYRHGVRENVEYALPAGPRTLAEVFQENGYATSAFVAAFVLHRRFGLARGFELYQDALWGPEPGLGPQAVELPGDVVANRAASWLSEYSARRRNGSESRPFFLFVHFFDAHGPYRPPPRFAQAFPERPYDGELAYQDACLGKLLDALQASGEAGRTLVWVVSDHGEGLGDHGEPQHSVFVYDSTVRVVSILRPPPKDGLLAEGEPRLRIDAHTSLIEVAPTLLDLAGVTAGLPEAEGRSLRPLLEGGGAFAEPVYCETYSPRISYHWAPLLAVRTREWKYIRAPKRELYHLLSDPGEKTNLIDQRQAEADRLDGELSTILQLAQGSTTAARRAPTAEERERLRSLGYVGAGGVAPSESEDLPDPKDMMSAFEARYREITSLMRDRRFDEAARLAREAVRVDPFNNLLLYDLATALRGGGKLEEAGRAYREALRVQPQSPRSWQGWGEALLQGGDADSAVWAFSRGIDLLPSAPDCWIGRAGAFWEGGKPVTAKSDLDSALARGGNPAVVHGLLARLHRDALQDPKGYAEHLEIYARLCRTTPEAAAEKLPKVR